jgi:hypothetical protein
MGGAVERLEIDKAKAIRTADFATQYKIQQEIDSLKDEDPNASPEKANFFGKLGQKFFNKKQAEESVEESANSSEAPAINAAPASLDESSDYVANVLQAHGVFGKFDDSDDSEYEIQRLKYAVSDFKSLVEAHAASGEHDLEITYRESDTRIIVKTEMVDGTPALKSVVAFNHPHKNDIDYKDLNKDIQKVFGLGSK